ncbi:AraC family transcriptional regulator [Cohnella boryungensis]|uniref:AraC family transcriptional regulator n=1 Tax=Cohnella boryungensis TaxID=768479 RepID=A0ABV8SGF8_9BACL
MDYLFLYMEKGRYVLTIEGVEYELLEGEFALIQPGQLFTTHGFGDCVVPNAHLDFFYNPLREKSFVTTPGMTVLNKYTRLAQPGLDVLGLKSMPPVFAPDNPKKMKNTILQMVEFHKSNNLASILKVQQLALDLLAQLIENSSQRPPSDYIEHRFKAKMEAYLSSNLTESLSIAEMAHYVGYSESHFCLIFKKVFGESPHHYLVRMRIMKAKELLRTTELHLEVIAQYCGFANASHFSKTFKLHADMTPTQFRQNASAEMDEV